MVVVLHHATSFVLGPAVINTHTINTHAHSTPGSHTLC
jgi:hypothetical protein